MWKLRDVQKRLVEEAIEILKTHRICYIVGEMRVGKTLPAVVIARNIAGNNGRVLFLSTKNGCAEFHKTLVNSGYGFPGAMISTLESAHKHIGIKYDLVVIDEAHRIGAIPNKGVRAEVCKNIGHNSDYVLLMSGTPTPEKYASIYHQLDVSPYSPLKKFGSFEKFASSFYKQEEKYVRKGVKKKFYGDPFSENAISMLWRHIAVAAAREEAGIFTKRNVFVHRLNAPQIVLDVVDSIYKGCVVINNVAYPIKNSSHEMQSIARACSGVFHDTESDRVFVISKYKIDYIMNHIATNGRTVIFYNYDSEARVIMGYGIPVNDVSKRANVIALQIGSNSEGLDLSDYTNIVYLQLVYSNRLFMQSIARGDSSKNDSVNIHFLFSDIGYEELVFNALCAKKRFYSKYYEDWRQSGKIEFHGDFGVITRGGIFVEVDDPTKYYHLWRDARAVNFEKVENKNKIVI